MDKMKVEQYLLNNRDYFADEDIYVIYTHLHEIPDDRWPSLSNVQLKDPQTALMLSIFGGPIGVDRFYLDMPALGWLKTLTCGGFLLWAFIDVFLVKDEAYEYNKQKLLNFNNYGN